jgi:hypothetical protein
VAHEIHGVNPNTRRKLGNLVAYFRRLLAAFVGGIPSDWESSEQHVAAQLRGPLRDHRVLARDLDNLAFQLLQTIKQLRQPAELFGAHATLMVRVLQDLRVCGKAAEIGYPMQAWTVAASCFEAAHTMGFLAVAPERAADWWKHSDTERSFCSARAAIEGSYKYLDLGEQGAQRQHLVDHEYQIYQRLCLAKHVNPVAERTRYFTRHGGGQQLRLTPFASDSRARESRLGFLFAIRSATLALWVFHRCHLKVDTSDDPRIVALANVTLSLLEKWKDVQS